MAEFMFSNVAYRVTVYRTGSKPKYPDILIFRGYQFGLIGHYNLQGDLTNGRHYWVKDNGAYGIWYTNINVVCTNSIRSLDG
jgi:hypothetical protein